MLPDHLGTCRSRLLLLPHHLDCDYSSKAPTQLIFPRVVGALMSNRMNLKTSLSTSALLCMQEERCFAPQLGFHQIKLPFRASNCPTSINVISYGLNAIVLFFRIFSVAPWRCPAAWRFSYCSHPPGYHMASVRSELICSGVACFLHSWQSYHHQICMLALLASFHILSFIFKTACFRKARYSPGFLKSYVVPQARTV